MEQLFFELIRVAIGTQETLSRPPSACEWAELYAMSQKQSLIGICFAAVQKLQCNDNQEPSTHNPKLEPTHNQEPITHNLDEVLFLQWMGMAAKIQQRNEVMNEHTAKTLEYFRMHGFPCCVLKGQGVATLYGSLAGLRQSGDIDVWVNSPRRELYEFSKKELGKITGLTYHHIHYDMYQDVEVEAHTWPAFFTSPIKNKSFHEFCKLHEPRSGCSDTPSLAFNRVFILQHCYGHFCGHGVGFRQLLDYYFVLMQGFTEVDRKESLRWIERLGMKRFAAALMWLCKKVFGVPADKCICVPDEKGGRFLLDEVMQTGNMGHMDERVDHRKLQSAWGRYIHNFKRDWRIMRIAPSYALWEPFWGIFQYTYKNSINRRYNNV